MLECILLVQLLLFGSFFWSVFSFLNLNGLFSRLQVFYSFTRSGIITRLAMLDWCNDFLLFFATTLLIFLAVMRNVYLVVLKAYQRSMLVILIRLLTFLVQGIFTNFSHVKWKFFSSLVFMLGSCWHQNVFKSKLVVVRVI